MSLCASSRLRRGVLASAAVSVLVAIAIGLRGAASLGPLWLDEIWSLNTAVQLHAPSEILTDVKHDNNHFLNTLYLFLLGPDCRWFVYRIHSITAGVLSVIMAGLIASQRGQAERIIAMLLMSLSCLLVHYGSEARGYSLLILFSLSCCYGLDRFLVTRRWRWALLFAACGSLGFLSHPTFLTVYLAALYWWFVPSFERFRLARRTKEPCSHRNAWPRGAVEIVCLMTPLGVAVLIYALNLRFLKLGGGPDYSLPALLVESASLTLGGPQTGAAAWCAAALLVAGVVLGLQLVRKDPSGSWRFYLVAIGAPVAQAIVARPPFLFVRYFLVPAAFGLLLVSFVLADWFRRGAGWRWLSLAAILLFATGNMAHNQTLLQIGRGQYPAALQFMADQTKAGEVRFASDHHHGVSILVDFYARYVHPPRVLKYERSSDWEQRPPDWLIMHAYHTGRSESIPGFHWVGANFYRLRRSFDCAMLSGWRWHCYQLQASTVAAAH